MKSRQQPYDGALALELPDSEGVEPWHVNPKGGKP